jgi:hypothetical protein
MAVPTANLAQKKNSYISSVVAAAQALYAANAALVALQAEYQNEYNTGQSAALVDADFTGNNDYMNQAAMSSFFSGPQASVAAAVAANLQTLLAMLPQ